jgi:hypothetical protein
MSIGSAYIEPEHRRFENVPYKERKGMHTKEEVEADVKASLVEDYNYHYGCEYKALMMQIRGYKEKIAQLEITKSEMKYEPPKFDKK